MRPRPRRTCLAPGPSVLPFAARGLGRDGMPAPAGGFRRVTDRASFAALRTAPRTRRGALSVTYLAAPAGGTDVRVAFQVGKASGAAVARNRIRRRLRAGLRELQQRRQLPPGTYLLGGRGSIATQPWPELLADLTAAVAAATAGSAPERAR